MSHHLSSFLDHLFYFPNTAQVCHLDSKEVGADLDNAPEAIFVLCRQSIPYIDQLICIKVKIKSQIFAIYSEKISFNMR